MMRLCWPAVRTWSVIVGVGLLLGVMTQVSLGREPHSAAAKRGAGARVLVAFTVGIAPFDRPILAVLANGRVLARHGPQATNWPPGVLKVRGWSHLAPRIMRHLRSYVAAVATPAQRESALPSLNQKEYVLTFIRRGVRYEILFVAKGDTRRHATGPPPSKALWRLVRYLRLIVRNHLKYDR